MKKLIFFMLFLVVCSVGVYAYFYWKAMQVKTPIVSVEITIPKKPLPKTVPNLNRTATVKKEEQKVQRIVSEPQEEPQNIEAQKEQSAVKVEEQKPAVIQNVPVVSENTVKQEETKSQETSARKVQEVQADTVVPQEMPASEPDKKEDVLNEKAPEPAPLLIPTTEPIVKEEVPTSPTP